MRYKALLLAFVAVVMMFGTDAEARVKVTGHITNSITGEGIRGVPVTDGYSYVKTDAKGNYKITPDKRATRIYYSTPSEYELNLDNERHLPLFYSQREIKSNGKQTFDFSLTPLAGGPEKDFTLIMIGDPQCTSAKQSNRYQNETVADVKATADACQGKVYAVTLGDVTFDSSDMWDRMAETMSNVTVSGGYLTFFQCMGNHDHNSLVEDSQNDEVDDINARRLFVETFGPADYSFNRGDVHIVVMDDIIVNSQKSSTKPNKSTWGYKEGFTEEQLEWFKQDIACVDNPQEKLLIFCVHAPLQGSAAKDSIKKEMLEQMTCFKECHIMAGHTHTQRNYLHKSFITRGGTPVYEHIHGTACGAWWVNNTNLGGSPCGYNVYSVKGSNVASWRFKGTGRPENYQLRIYDGSQTYTGKRNIEYRWYDLETKDEKGTVTIGFAEAKGALVAEVFDDDNVNWKLEMWIDGKKAGNFIRKGGKVSNVPLAAFYHNVQGRKGKYWRGSNNSHFWYFSLPEGITAESLESGEHQWEARAVFTVPTNTSNILTYTCSHITRDYSEF